MSFPPIGPGLGALIRQGASGAFWELLASLVSNDSQVPGRRVRDALNYLYSAQYWTVTDWYVDPANGDDAADGLSPATAFATYEPVNQRIGSPQVVLAQDTTVHVLSDMPDTAPPLVFLGIIVTPNIFRVRQEAPTSLGTFTLGTVQNIAIGSTRPSIQLNPPVDLRTAGAGGTSLEGQRMRKVGGAGGAPTGTLFWIEEIDAIDPTIAYVSRPQFAVPPSFATTQSLTTGASYECEELGIMGRMDLVPRDNQVVNFATETVSVSVENGRGVMTESVEIASTFGPSVGSAGVGVHGCFLNYGRVFVDFTNLQACRIGTLAFTRALYSRRLVYLTGVSVMGNLQFGGNGQLQMYNSVSFSRSKLVTEETSGIPTYLVWDAVSFWNWSAAVAFSGAGGQGWIRGLLWGTSTVAGTRGLNIHSRGRFTYSAANVPALAGTEPIDFNIGGATGVWADLPFINPANNAMLVAQ